MIGEVIAKVDKKEMKMIEKYHVYRETCQREIDILLMKITTSSIKEQMILKRHIKKDIAEKYDYFSVNRDNGDIMGHRCGNDCSRVVKEKDHISIQ